MLCFISGGKICHDLKTAVPNFSDDNSTYRYCIDKLCSIYEPEKNLTAKSYWFHKMEQLSNEYLEDFKYKLWIQSDWDDQIWDQIVFKCPSTKL